MRELLEQAAASLETEATWREAAGYKGRAAELDRLVAKIHTALMEV